MPQNDELSRVPLRLPQPPRDAPPSVQRWMSELDRALNQWVRASANINVRSGVRGFEDDDNGGYFLGFARNVSGITDGTPVFFVGDRSADKFFQFNGTDVSIGLNTKFPGVDAYNNTSTEFHTWFDSIDGFTQTTSGGGSVSLDGTGVSVSVGGSSGDNAELNKVPEHPIREDSGKGFASKKRFKARIEKTGGVSNLTAYIYVGFLGSAAGVDTNGAFGFKIVNSSTLLGFINDNGETTANLGVSISSSGTLLEAVKRSGGVDFYVDGALEGSIESTITTTALGANAVCNMEIENTAAGSSATLKVSEWKYTTN